MTRKGGHCAHLQGLNPLGSSYLDDTIVSFFKTVLAIPSPKKEE